MSRHGDGLRTGRPGFDSRHGYDFSLLQIVHTGSGDYTASCIMVLQKLLPGERRPGPEADNSPLSSAKVKKDGAIPPLPRISSWHTAELIEHRGSTFTHFNIFILSIPTNGSLNCSCCRFYPCFVWHSVSTFHWRTLNTGLINYFITWSMYLWTNL
jgi:hypothetical protein